MGAAGEALVPELLQGTLAGGVNQAGAIRGIKPKLPEGVQIDVLVPSYSWGVDCVHDGGLLSFEHGEGKLVPLIGTAEPAAAAAPADQPKPTSSKADWQ